MLIPSHDYDNWKLFFLFLKNVYIIFVIKYNVLHDLYLFSVSEDFLVSSCYLCRTVLDFCGLLQFFSSPLQPGSQRLIVQTQFLRLPDHCAGVVDGHHASG